MPKNYSSKTCTKMLSNPPDISETLFPFQNWKNKKKTGQISEKGKKSSNGLTLLYAPHKLPLKMCYILAVDCESGKVST